MNPPDVLWLQLQLDVSRIVDRVVDVLYCSG